MTRAPPTNPKTPSLVWFASPMCHLYIYCHHKLAKHPTAEKFCCSSFLFRFGWLYFWSNKTHDARADLGVSPRAFLKDTRLDLWRLCPYLWLGLWNMRSWCSRPPVQRKKKTRLLIIHESHLRLTPEVIKPIVVYDHREAKCDTHFL